MTKTKLILAYIANDRARKASFKKRTKGLIKKADELCTLCDVKACAIIGNPYDNEPEVWPSNLRAQQVISEFKKLPEHVQSRNKEDNQSICQERIAKKEGKLRKQYMDNNQKELTKIMYMCLVSGAFQNLSLASSESLVFLLNQNIKDVGRRIELLQNTLFPSQDNVE
ncbi:hypothetical protein Acr_07g0005980 [Actinidia rufa]|uniref:MADS-box domain-containing protein n=1 Tax=Actinidia rufa TaxID=165716 RepID=A0A7J0EV95_9ERIC|nr:hypothetical protein Acr_07g0005980 [Actinidia rufa]